MGGSEAHSPLQREEHAGTSAVTVDGMGHRPDLIARPRCSL
jgi:hypothetical protein